MSLYLLLVLIIVMIGFSKVQSNRRRKNMATLEEAVQPGVRVVTTAGIYGIVVEIESDTIVLEISEGVDVRFAKAAVVRVVPALDDDIDDAFDGDDEIDDVDVDGESDAHHDGDSGHDLDVARRPADDVSSDKSRKNHKRDKVVAGELSDADLHAELDAVSAPGGAGRQAAGNESGNGPVTGA